MYYAKWNKLGGKNCFIHSSVSHLSVKYREKNEGIDSGWWRQIRVPGLLNSDYQIYSREKDENID